MAYADLVTKAKTYFPTFQVKYKDQSAFMQIIGKILFFNKDFMTNFITTIGNTVYVPSEKFVEDNQQNLSGVLIHECTHMYDSKRLGPLFTLGYLFPQILALPALLLFLVSWKIALPLFLLALLPWPAYWRTHLEQRAYYVGMYARYKIFGYDPIGEGNYYAHFFKDGSYYWMWPFGVDAEFNQEGSNIEDDKPACASEPALYQMVNDLIAAAKQ